MKGKYGSAFSDFADNDQYFSITMCQAPCKEPCCCCASMVCFPCAQLKMRHMALNNVTPGSGWTNYLCCQGYFGGLCCFQPGECCESSCPIPCMCAEACICPGLAVTATSMVIRNQYGLGLDEDDIRLIRCNNCLQIFACLLGCFGMCFDWAGEEECRSVVDCVAHCVFMTVSGCMTAQVYHEIKEREKMSPQRQVMER